MTSVFRIFDHPRSFSRYQYNNVKFCILVLLQIIAGSLSESVSDHVKAKQECNVNVCGKMFVTNELTTDLVVRKYPHAPHLSKINGPSYQMVRCMVMWLLN